MRKILIFIFTILLVGCSLDLGGSSPTREVEKLLGNYQSFSNEVKTQLDDSLNGLELSSNSKSLYKEAMERQYKNMSYVIKDETIDGNTAVVTVEIEVYDYDIARTKTEEYSTTNPNAFLDDAGNISQDKYNDYKIELLKGIDEKIKYTLELTLSKVDDEWELDNLSDIERQKISGVYTE